jgi:hypothetical protein
MQEERPKRAHFTMHGQRLKELSKLIRSGHGQTVPWTDDADIYAEFAAHQYALFDRSTVEKKLAAAALPPLMDLTNMRSLGVTRVDVDVYCGCGHQASVDVSKLPGDLPVPDVRLRLRCSKCGKRPNETRPDWSQYRPKGRYMPEGRE